MDNLNYDEILNEWHDKVVEKADKYMEKAESYEFGSHEYFRLKSHADGLYMALSMLALEERKAKRKKKKDNLADVN